MEGGGRKGKSESRYAYLTYVLYLTLLYFARKEEGGGREEEGKPESRYAYLTYSLPYPREKRDGQRLTVGRREEGRREEGRGREEVGKVGIPLCLTYLLYLTLLYFTYILLTRTKNDF